MDDKALLFVAWVLSAAVLVAAASRWGPEATRPWNLLLSKSGDVSLTNIQVALWTVVVLSLVAAVLISRLPGEAAAAFDFEIPDELLAAMGISVGSAVVSAASPRRSGIALAGSPPPSPQLRHAISTIDANGNAIPEISRFQLLWLTVIAIGGYVAMTIATIAEASEPIEGLPGFTGNLNILLAISHGGYLVKKTVENNNGGVGSPP